MWMQKKLKLVGIIALAVLIVFGIYMQFTGNKNDMDRGLVNSDPLEIYVGGACTCPPSEGQKLEVIKLYRSKGESIEQIKDLEKRVECSHLGCAMAKEYRLYP